MLLDHFPNNVLKTLETVLEEQRTEIIDFPKITIIPSQSWGGISCT